MADARRDGLRWRPRRIGAHYSAQLDHRDHFIQVWCDEIGDTRGQCLCLWHTRDRPPKRECFAQRDSRCCALQLLVYGFLVCCRLRAIMNNGDESWGDQTERRPAGVIWCSFAANRKSCKQAFCNHTAVEESHRSSVSEENMNIHV